MTRWTCLFACALSLAVAEDPPTWTPAHQRDLIARTTANGALQRVLGTRGFKDAERGEAILVKGEQLDGVLRATFEVRTLGGMREERLVLQSDLRVEDGTFVAMRFLLVRGPQRVKGEAKVTGETLEAQVWTCDAQGNWGEPEALEHPWDPSAQPMSWILGFLAPLSDGKLPPAIRGRVYNGYELRMAPDVATITWGEVDGVRALTVEGGLPHDSTARAARWTKGQAWIELGAPKGRRHLALPQEEVKALVEAQPIGLE